MVSPLTSSPFVCACVIGLCAHSWLGMLRHRTLFVLRVAALRTVTSPGKVSKASSETSDTPTAPQRSKLADVRAGERADAPTAPPLHHSPVQANSTRNIYGKEGYNFIEHLRTSGPGAALGRVRWTLSVYVLIGTVVLVYLVYYLTTYTYVLTTNPAPYRNSLFQHFPCDLAIIENKFTHKRHVVEVTPALAPLLRDGPAIGDALGDLDSAAASVTDRSASDPPKEVAATRLVHPAPAIVERKLHVNALLHRVYLYLQRSRSLVLVNAQAELNPQRFMSRANSVGREYRASVGFLREDQLLPDVAAATEKTGASSRQSSWWPWRSASAKRVSHASSASSSATTCGGVGPSLIYVESEVRLRDAMNGYQKGHLYTYEQTMAHVVQEKLTQRFYDYVLKRGMEEHKGLRKVYAEEMVRNGLISGSGVALSQLVPDVGQFADEVLREVKDKFGDDVIVYTYSVKLH